MQEMCKQGACDRQTHRCFSCGTCNACDNCYLVCPEPCITRSSRSNGLYKIIVDYCKGCRVCIEECPTGCLEGVPELDFDTGVVRMDTAIRDHAAACTAGRRRGAAQAPAGAGRTRTDASGTWRSMDGRRRRRSA
jgi:Pyruvate/2-oxoacid:ferredoxin oxidoreductase delta subunit